MMAGRQDEIFDEKPSFSGDWGVYERVFFFDPNVIDRHRPAPLQEFGIPYIFQRGFGMHPKSA